MAAKPKSKPAVNLPPVVQQAIDPKKPKATPTEMAKATDEGAASSKKGNLPVALGGTPTPTPLASDGIRKTSQGDTFTLAGKGGIARSDFKSEESYREALNIRGMDNHTNMKPTGMIGGFSPAGLTAVQEQQAAQERAAAATAQIGNISEEEQAAADAANQLEGGIGLKEAVTKAGLAAGTAASTAAIAGSVAAPVTAGLSIPVAAGAAGATAFIGTLGYSIFSNLKSNAIQNVKVQKYTYNDGVTNMKAIIEAANNGADPIDVVNLYNAELAKIRTAERNLKELSKKDYAKAKDELVAINRFETTGRIAIEAALSQALANPDPKRKLDITGLTSATEEGVLNE